MQVEDDRGRGPSGPPDIRTPTVETDTAVTDARTELTMLIARLTALESDLAALKTGLSIIETRLTGIENRQRHAEGRRERIESRFSDIDFGVDRVYADMATLRDRVRCVELDLRELSGTLCRGSRHDSDVLGPLSYSVSHPVGFKSS